MTRRVFLAATNEKENSMYMPYGSRRNVGPDATKSVLRVSDKAILSILGYKD